ncbi:MAG: VanZ family protein [Phycisphaerae bacterium]
MPDAAMPVEPTSTQPDQQGGAGSASKPVSTHELINFIHGHVLELITVFYLTYLMLGTLLPLDFSLSAATGPDRSFLGLGAAPSGLPDLLSNVALYLPLGVLFHMTVVRRFGRPVVSILPAVVAAMTLSLTIEAAQLFSLTRVSSAIDFGANSLGALGGATLSAICRGPERRLLWALSKELGSNTLPTVVKASAGLLVVGALVPFTPTLDAARMRGMVRSGTIIPFQEDADLAQKADQALVWENRDDAAAYRRDRMLLWGSWFAEAVSFGLFGWLLHRLLRESVGFGPMSSASLCLYLASLLALFMSVIQIVILSRGFHSTDILFRVAGACGGYSLRWIRCAAGLGILERARPRRWRWAAATLLVAVGLILFTGLAPFSWEASPEGFLSRLNSAEIVPFHSYYLGRFDRVCADFWGKSLRYGFLAVGLWAWWPIRRGGSLQSKTARIALTTLGLALLVEMAQLFIRSRVPSVTDLLIAGVAGCVAPIWCQYLLDFYVHALKRHSGRRRIQTPQPRMSPADWLIASLIPAVTYEPRPPETSQNPHQQT